MRHLWLIVPLAVAVGSLAYFQRGRQLERQPLPLDPMDVVRRAWTTGRRVELTGAQRITMPRPDGEPLQLEARVESDNAGRMRIEYLSAPLRGVTIWQDDARTYRYNPGRRQMTVARRRDSEEVPLDMLDNCRAESAGREVVAGREAVVLTLIPSSGGNRQRLWIDPVNWVTLRTDVLSPSGAVTRSARFIQISFGSGSADPGRFQPSPELLRLAVAKPGDTSARFAVHDLSRLIGFEIRMPGWVPPGYRLEGAYQVPCECGSRHQAARLEFTDSINFLTMFQCGHPRCSYRSNCFAQGGATRDAVELRSGKWSFLAVGDVSRSDLQKFLNSTLPPPGSTQSPAP